VDESSTKNYVRQQAALAARGLPPKPDWLPEDAARAWRLLWLGRGSEHFRAAWFEGPSEKRKVRLLLSRALCCGWEEADCARLVEHWLRFHGVSGADKHVFMVVDFHCALEVVRQYLSRRQVLERTAEKHRRRELEKVARWQERTATRVLRFLLEHPGCRRLEVQGSLGLKADALKRQLQRLERDGLARLSHFESSAGAKPFRISEGYP
jgi:hypothetical protein